MWLMSRTTAAVLALTLLPFAAAALEPSAPRADSVVRVVELTDAALLLKSTEGTAWRVVATTAPACTTLDSHTSCTEKKRQCKAAKAVAKKSGAHAVCSALYGKATVILTTAPATPKTEETAGGQ